MKTKGASASGSSTPAPSSIEEIEISDPRQGRGQIQMEASGICHSDHHLVTSDIPMAGFPCRRPRGRRHRHRGSHRRERRPATTSACRSSRPAVVVRPVEGVERNLCDLGALLAGTAVFDGAHRVTTPDGTPVVR